MLPLSYMLQLCKYIKIRGGESGGSGVNGSDDRLREIERQAKGNSERNWVRELDRDIERVIRKSVGEKEIQTKRATERDRGTETEYKWERWRDSRRDR